MSLSVGIVGLPNAGKSTLFNALASRRLAETDIRPFTTIDPHEAVVSVPDKNLEKLTKLIKPEQTVPAVVTFIDIAGLVKGAHKGEGLGNQFLGKIREVDAIVHVVRAFDNPTVVHSHPIYQMGSVKQVLEDIEIINIELELGEIEKKPVIYVINVDEGGINDMTIISEIEKKFSSKAITISAKMEEDLIDFSIKEKTQYLKEAGLKLTGLEKLIQFSYQLLDLITFYTIKGGKEISAWSLKNGENIIDAAGIVHTDFAKKFIKAEVINVRKLLDAGSWKDAREKGLIRLEGKGYVVKDKDVIEFKVGL